jgi:hypothetical protein
VVNPKTRPAGGGRPDRAAFWMIGKQEMTGPELSAHLSVGISSPFEEVIELHSHRVTRRRNWLLDPGAGRCTVVRWSKHATSINGSAILNTAGIFRFRRESASCCSYSKMTSATIRPPRQKLSIASLFGRRREPALQRCPRGSCESVPKEHVDHLSEARANNPKVV